MSATAIVLEGTVKPDGTLELDEKLNLPAGRVKVTVQAGYDRANDPFFQRMEVIWAALREAGHVPRTKEAIDAEINELRDDAEEEMQEVERLHEDCERVRREAGGKTGGEP